MIVSLTFLTKIDLVFPFFPFFKGHPIIRTHYGASEDFVKLESTFVEMEYDLNANCTWGLYKDKHLHQLNESKSVEQHGNKLKLKYLESEHSGVYCCLVKNEFGEAFRCFSVRVKSRFNFNDK